LIFLGILLNQLFMCVVLLVVRRLQDHEAISKEIVIIDPFIVLVGILLVRYKGLSAVKDELGCGHTRDSISQVTLCSQIVIKGSRAQSKDL